MLSLNGINDPKVRDFIKGLSVSEQRVVGRLQRLLTQSTRTLRWYWEIGNLLRNLKGAKTRFQYGQDCTNKLKAYLGLKETLLIKSARLASAFSKAHIIELESLEVSWTMALLSLPLRTFSKRMQILRLASRHGWGVARTRLEVRNRLGEPQHPGPGRDPEPIDTEAPEIELQRLIWKAKEWTRYQEVVWLAKGARLDILQQATPGPLKSRVDRRLELAVDALQAVLRVTKQVHQRTGRLMSLREV